MDFKTQNNQNDLGSFTSRWKKKKTSEKLLSPAEEESSTEKVGEQTGGVVHLGEDHLVAHGTGSLHRAVP